MPIEVRQENEIAWLRIARPQRANALDEADLTAFRRAVVRLGDVPPRVVVLEAAGADFSVGLDLEADNTMFDTLLPLARRGDRFAVQERLVGYRLALDSLGRLPSTIVAAIRGRCAGLGLELALAADLRLAAADSSFSLPGALIGLQHWGGGIARLTRLLGRTRATDLAITGRTIDASTAESWGLVNRLVEDPDAAAYALAHALREAPQASIQQTLLALRAAEDLTEKAFLTEAETAARSLCRELESGLERWRATKAWKPLC